MVKFIKWIIFRSEDVMKSIIKQSVVIAIIFAVLALAAACKSGPQFKDVQAKEWKLIEIKSESGKIGYDRSKLENETFGDIFTMKFDAERVSGKGAVNRYTTAFELGTGKDRAITFKPVAATLMAPLREPEKFRETDFFTLLSNVYQWNIDKSGHLELSTKAEDGNDVVLIFE
jgi:heat shock protein HslJ